MSMSREPENFDGLIRLLALKRHEQPPPGYFESFHRQVVARIESGDGAAGGFSLAEWLGGAPVLSRLWNALDARPALAGAFGLAMGALLLSGAIYTGSDAAALPSLPIVADGGFSAVRVQDPPAVPALALPASQSFDLPATAVLLGTHPQKSLFEQNRERDPWNTQPAALFR